MGTMRITDIGSHLQDHRRVFAHPHIFLITRGLVDPMHSLKIASLSAEPSPGSSFVAAAFDVNMDDALREVY